MSAEPEKTAATPASETAPAPVSAPVTIFSGKSSKDKGPGVPGEPYTPMPDLSKPARPRWLYALAALLLALAAAGGLLFIHMRSPAPAAQPAPIEAPADPGPQAGIK